MGGYEFIGLRRFLDRACAARSGATFLHARGREWTYADLGAITDGLAAELLALGLAPGERVAMMMPAGPEHLFAWLAVVKLGAVACPIHTELSPDETAAVIEHLEPAALIYDISLASKALAPGVRAPGIVIVGGDAQGTGESGSATEPGPEERPASAGSRAVSRPEGTSASAASRPGLHPEGTPAGAASRTVVRLADLLTSRRPLEGIPEPGPEDVAEILTTSGTTGTPKAAMIPHRMPVLTGEAFAHWLGLTSDDRLFTCLPFSHINARSYSTMGAIASGASLVLEGKFSASRFWGWIASSGATQFNAIGAMLRILLARPEAPEDRSHHARLAYAAPALGEEAHTRFENRFGLRLVIGYGLTESTFGFIHSLTGSRNLVAMGHPRRHSEPSLEAGVRLVVELGPGGDKPGSRGAELCLDGEPDSGGAELGPGGATGPRVSVAWRDAAPGEAGEVWLRNPATFLGYWRDEAMTRATFAGEWLRTGDLARRENDGEYIFVARLKQLIRRRGENLAPGEVEAALETHPAVLEAAVVGVPSPLGEEDVRAYMVLRPGSRATAEDLASHCVARLAAFKTPTQWRFLDRLPRTPTARIAYHLLPHDEE